MRKLLLILGIFLLPSVALAHEVYVLSTDEIHNAMYAQPFDMLQVALQNLHQVIFWAFIGFVLVSTVFCISIFRIFEKWLEPFFARGKRYAPLICRVTVGLGLLAGAYYEASFGPELPYAAMFGAFTPLITVITAAIALSMLSGIWMRQAALVALALFAFAIWRNGVYMLTYTNYLGEFLVLALIAKHASGARTTWARYEPAIVRVAFGISLLYSAIYAKIIHNNLALMIADMPLAGHAHGVAYYFGFEPHFMVLGAAIIEIVIAIFFIVGFEIRWTCIFLEFWLALSLWWFGESVWPHLVLIGIPVALFFWGYDKYSLEGRFFKRGNLEPVL